MYRIHVGELRWWIQYARSMHHAGETQKAFFGNYQRNSALLERSSSEGPFITDYARDCNPARLLFLLVSLSL